MKYPKFDGKPMDKINQFKFERFYDCIFDSIDYDVVNNNLALSARDIELISRNAAMAMIVIEL